MPKNTCFNYIFFQDIELYGVLCSNNAIRLNRGFKLESVKKHYLIKTKNMIKLLEFMCNYY